MSREKRYPSDLSDKEWELIADLMKADPLGGRPPKYSRHEILNAIFYVAKNWLPMEVSSQKSSSLEGDLYAIFQMA